MLISELINHLIRLQNLVGDLPVIEGDYGSPIAEPTFEKEWRQTRGQGSPCTLENVIVI